MAPTMNVVLDNWRTHWAGPATEIALALIAVLCGAVLGTERERHQKPAGLRTLMLVCLGSCLFTMVGFVFTSSTGDSGRVAAQIVTGIGFLGAGAILHGPGLVSGMTTAASIWVTAAIGMIAGAGYPIAAFGATLLARSVLSGVRAVEVHTMRRGGLVSITATFDQDRGKTRVRLERVFNDFDVHPDQVQWKETDDRQGLVVLNVYLHGRPLCELADQIARMPGVLSISREDDPDPGAAG
jgi:putative Mg2+ transporter-C (MgtC) family protein